MDLERSPHVFALWFQSGSIAWNLFVAKSRKKKREGVQRTIHDPTPSRLERL